MISGVVMLLLLTVGGAFAGSKIAGWYLDEKRAELESAIVPAVGGIIGAVVALALGIGVAYFVGKNEADKDS